VEQIAEAADHANKLIRHLVAFAKRQETEPTLVDLGQMLSDATGLLGEVLGEHVPIVLPQAGSPPRPAGTHGSDPSWARGPPSPWCGVRRSGQSHAPRLADTVHVGL